jgi:hypothetical protein
MFQALKSTLRFYLRILLNPTTDNGTHGGMRYAIYPAMCNGYVPPGGQQAIQAC